ncbi:MATE family efflux transporter [Celerinatantimonas yamalensis]|uniref:MATE family efflux transporter n=1 Tax=Celerinatantimonas yamalensis TaxID=559956 RepID=A0ABW9G5K1_9GAMM
MHTKFTLRNFSSYATLSFTIGLVTVGFGAIDLIMVSALGEVHVAGVGIGELIVTCILASMLGFVDVFAAKLAALEGSGAVRSKQLSLALGFLWSVLVCALLALILTALIQPALILFGQVKTLIRPITDYTEWRLLGTAPFLIYMAASEALKICGQRTRALHILIAGFIANAGLNALFLYTPVASFFASPEAAVAAGTVLVHLFMGVIAAWIWLSQIGMPPKTKRFEIVTGAWKNFAMLVTKAPGVMVRIFNDYVGSVIPMLFIGTISTQTAAAAAVATKIYTLFCRVPQATLSASYVYYSYDLAEHETHPASKKSADVVRRLFRYVALPTAIALVLTLLAAPAFIWVFGGGSVDSALVRSLLLAYLLFVPLYVIEQFYAELLTAHGCSGMLFGASSIATYLLTVPLAYISVFVWDSAFLAIALKSVAVGLLALCYFWYYRYRRRIERKVS